MKINREYRGRKTAGIVKVLLTGQVMPEIRCPDVGQETQGFSFDPGMTGFVGEGPRIIS